MIHEWMPRLCFIFLLTAFCSGLRAEVTLAPLFADHAVLQRDKPVPVWGRAKPGEKVTVAFLGQSVTVRAGDDGRWGAYLAPLAAQAAGADLVVTGENELVIHDVVVGEVWLCSGQSNMEFSVNGQNLHVLNAAQEVASAHYPLIRHFKVQKAESDAPIDTAAGSDLKIDGTATANARQQLQAGSDDHGWGKSGDGYYGTDRSIR